ncbi:hypothetical protein VPNG_02398 [Cytospora leucostoma]|uniref:Phosphoinositide phospholipase C n=1 Tax=Cytospora leucostoma TaxID=1230097 RepID=A0A423XH22_9PEZI|nr:hypothetical protein VPNG_02398 [Cytospora leucostoma]
MSSQNPETSQPSQLRSSRPSHVQTDNLIGQSQSTAAPHSAFTNSSMASSPQQVSPVCSPESEVLTTNSSIQPSPDPIRGRESEACPISSIEPLPEPIISRKTSTNSLPQSVSSERSTEPAPPKLNIIRRISTRVKTESSRLRGNRRTSSTHPVSRDASVGPAVLRRGRSDSSATAPPDYAVAIGSESDDEAGVAKEQQVSFPVPIAEGEALRDFSPASGAASVAASSTSSDIHTGPVIPQTLLQGMMISKVSTKRRKRLNLVLDAEAGKVFWDKNRPSKCVYIDDIKEIRVSPEVRQYRLDCGAAEAEETRFFSILYAVPDKKQKTMHLIADDDESFQAWVTTLDALAKHRQALMSSLMSFNDRAIRIYWRKEMARIYSESRPVDEQIDFAGVERVCRNLHIHVSQESLKVRFDEADRTQTGHLNFDEFQDFVRLTARRGDVRAVYREIASDPEGGLTYEDFVRFLKEVQNENVGDVASWEAVFKQFSRGKSVEASPTGGSSEQPRMSESALAKYLTSIHNTPLEAVPKDCGLDRPINEYFISSSHNTYLIGRQVGDVSSIEGYISALMRGCRCVEVDCWDGPDNQPIVTHGKTLTSQIQFREVIGAINKYAFVKSAYPLWISLEVHCNPIQQEVMANIMKDIFGEKLVTGKLEGCEDRLPTPEQLKGRILVKCKTPNFGEAKSADTNGNGRKRGNSLTSPFSRPTAVAEPSIPNSPLLVPTPPGVQRGNSRRVNTITEGEISNTQENLSSSSSDDSGVERTRRSKQSKITKVLGDLGVYCLGIKFRGFDDADCKIFNHILSFKEGTFLNNSSTKASKGALFRHNMRYLMRVYPGQYRFTSNNFDPLIYWRRGVQMAALNWQTFDLGMQFNQAMFAGGKDASGYVLKPRAFREIEMVPNSLRDFQSMPNYPEELNNKRERKNVTFTIDIISAQQLMRPFNLGERRTVNPYVEVEVFLADDKRDKQEANGQPLRGPLRHRTKIIKENGFNPVFDNTFTFNVRTKYPDLVFVRWSVKLSEGGNYNDRSPAVATYTAKLTSLKQGYRTLPLLDYNGDRYLFSTLFCRIKVDPITSVFVDYDAELENSNKLKSLGRTVFSRTAGQSPKSSFEKDSGFAP